MSATMAPVRGSAEHLLPTSCAGGCAFGVHQFATADTAHIVVFATSRQLECNPRCCHLDRILGSPFPFFDFIANSHL
ncbi:hypothetical protein BDQ12DRAFT_357201 [Crucibulum laeve]|uniref:Uncharacterized protein n=1 Tax=Crucibulum laeve TaxID=68775 RepID=A0A5C3M9X6_9AGAR|nr:hypothetical protein BDQ12DRAFT_357201 [Crucibulum laeve]